MEDRYQSLKLENQLCFPLYAAAREVTRKYTPYLNELDLTYTQYICMMVLWEKKHLPVKQMGELLFLDSGTLTPVLKALEKKGYVIRKRSEEDERSVIITITDEGMALRERAVDIPAKVGSCLDLTPEDSKHLYRILYKVLGGYKG